MYKVATPRCSTLPLCSDDVLRFGLDECMPMSRRDSRESEVAIDELTWQKMGAPEHPAFMVLKNVIGYLRTDISL